MLSSKKISFPEVCYAIVASGRALCGCKEGRSNGGDARELAQEIHNPGRALFVSTWPSRWRNGTRAGAQRFLLWSMKIGLYSRFGTAFSRRLRSCLRGRTKCNRMRMLKSWKGRCAFARLLPIPPAYGCWTSLGNGTGLFPNCSKNSLFPRRISLNTSPS
jgi:hypothetical protein